MQFTAKFPYPVFLTGYRLLNLAENMLELNMNYWHEAPQLFPLILSGLTNNDELLQK